MTDAFSDRAGSLSTGSGGRGGAAAFVPEAHLPAERRLLVDASGVVLEEALGVRHTLPWDQCTALLLWSDRAEIVLDGELSLLVRASDWHRGAEALRALAACAPLGLAVPMLDDPEVAPERYVLRGLPATSGAVLVTLVVAALGIAACGLVAPSRGPGLVIALAFGLAALVPLRALQRRSRVPRRWREAAAVRGRSSVAVDARLARTSDSGLRLAAPLLYAIAFALGVWLLSRGYAPWPCALLIALAVRVQGEDRRREQRAAVAAVVQAAAERPPGTRDR